ncbi:MAG: hypothetical protein HLUCCA01_10700 [Bacteroidetes bacterium HLUCCA01]|nr:MAG: hypothetical protein HLUCCA01_10700 [Bacteroidetes bacterium HLUCCA01]
MKPIRKKTNYTLAGLSLFGLLILCTYSAEAQQMSSEANVTDTRNVILRTENPNGNDYSALVSSYIVEQQSSSGLIRYVSLGFTYSHVTLNKAYWDSREVSGIIPGAENIPSNVRGSYSTPFSIQKESIRFSVRVTFSFQGEQHTTTTNIGTHHDHYYGGERIESPLIDLGQYFGDAVHEISFFGNFEIDSIEFWDSDWDHWQQFGRLKRDALAQNSVQDVLRQYCGGVSNNEASVREALGAVGRAMNAASSERDRQRLEECQQRLSDQLSAIFDQAAADNERNRRNQNPYYYAMQDAEAAERRGDYAAALEFYRRAYAYQPSPQLADKIQALETTVQAVAAAAGAAVVIGGLTNELRSGSTRLMRGALLMQLVYSGTDFSPSVGLGSGVTFDDIDGGYFSLERIVWFNPASTSGLNIGASAHFSESLSNKQLSRGSLDVSSHYINAHLNLHMLGFLELGPTFRYLKMEGSYEQNSTGREIGYGGDWQPAMGLRGAMYLKRQAEFFIRGIGWYVDTRPDSDYTIPGLFNSADRHMLSYGYRLELVWQPWSVSFYSSTDSYYNNVDNLHFGRNQWGVSLGFGFGF